MTNYFELSTETQTTNTTVYRLPSHTVHTAINLLFPSLEYNSKRKALYKYIQRKFATNHCCALYSLSKDFRKLYTQLSLDLGRREVIITSGGSILYTPEFTSEPLPVV